MDKELIWNVYRWNINNKNFEMVNIFKWISRDLYKLKTKYLKRSNYQVDAFMEEVRKELMYRFWGRTEYEIVLTDWPFKLIDKKIDIYDQIMLNWDRFKEYLLGNINLIKKPK